VLQQIDRGHRGSRAPRVAPVAQKAERLLPPAARDVLAILLHYPGVKRGLDMDAVLLALPDGPYRLLAERIAAAPAERQTIAAETLIQPDDDPALQDLAGEMLFSTPPCEPKAAAKMLAETVKDLDRRKLQAEFESVKTEMDAAVARGDEGRADELRIRLFALRKELKEIRL